MKNKLSGSISVVLFALLGKTEEKFHSHMIIFYDKITYSKCYFSTYRCCCTIMGNAGSNQTVSHSHTSGRDHRHGKEHAPPSPGKESQAFVFDKKSNQKLIFQSSHEEEEPYYTKVFNNLYKFLVTIDIYFLFYIDKSTGWR